VAESRVIGEQLRAQPLLDRADRVLALSMALRNKPDASALNCEQSGSGLGYSRPNRMEVASGRDWR
jgi:hypothetical protein